MLSENVTLELELGDGAHLIHADATQIRQVLLNLTSNAQEAMPHGGNLSIAVRTVVLGAEADLGGDFIAPGAYVELRVTDSGLGMGVATQARIFEPFFTTKGPDAGTGLGLAMVYGCIRQQGGHIHCTSKVGTGTTFTLLFGAIDQAELIDAPLAPRPPARDTSDTILLVALFLAKVPAARLPWVKIRKEGS